MARPKLLTRGRPVDPFAKSSIADTEKKLKELGARHRAALDSQTPEDTEEKLERAKKMKVEMIDPAFSTEKMNAIKIHRELFKYHDERFHSPANSQSEFPHIHGQIAADHAKKFYNLTGERLKSVSGAMHPPPEFNIEMIDPALAITGAIAGGVVAGNLLDRLRMALMKSPAEKDKTRRVEIERAQQAAKKPVKMPPMKFGSRKQS